MRWWFFRLSAKISAVLRRSVNFFFSVTVNKKFKKINFFCFKELNINKPLFLYL